MNLLKIQPLYFDKIDNKYKKQQNLRLMEFLYSDEY